MIVRYLTAVATIAMLFVSLAVLNTSEVYADDDLVTYRVTIENLTGGQPLTPPLIATHQGGVRMFRVGKAATFELKEIAENGNLGPMIGVLSSSKRVSEFVPAGAPSPLMPGGEVMVDITAGRGAQFISFVSMLICTNDGFTGLDRVKLPKKGSTELYAQGYDAGTEINTEDFADIVPPCPALTGVPSSKTGAGASNPALAQNGVIAHHPGIQGGVDLQTDIHGWTDPVVKVTITRVDDDDEGDEDENGERENDDRNDDDREHGERERDDRDHNEGDRGERRHDKDKN